MRQQKKPTFQQKTPAFPQKTPAFFLPIFLLCCALVAAQPAPAAAVCMSAVSISAVRGRFIQS